MPNTKAFLGAGRVAPAAAPGSGGPDYHHMQGLARGLAVLRTLNQAPRGQLFITEIARLTSLHRTTVKRILETLATEGYVQRSPIDNSYRLTLQVRHLSDGFTDSEWISDVATPIMGELLKQVQWPSDLTTLEGAAMLIRDSTHRFSPLSFHRGMVGRHMPLLFSASGRAYLAASSPARRLELIKVMIADGGPQSQIARNAKAVNTIIERVEAAGYASNAGEWIRDSGTHAIALPILRVGEPVGCLNIVFFRKAMSIEQAAETLLPALRAAVGRIEAKLEEPSGVLPAE
ncbi:MAG: DNA-binding transcriptional regulator [Pigmentiphaga sp.]|nr:DNA-binding transcriptional regulator [Pigmentiphaga sp.]